MSIAGMMEGMGEGARKAARALRKCQRKQKDAALHLMAAKLHERRRDIIAENAKDLRAARENGLSSAMIDRLTLNESVVAGMVEGLQEVAALPDPVGEVTGMWKRPNGLQVGRIRIPLGVTVDAAGLCLKSGNAVILKGGSEAIHSNIVLAALLGEALREVGLPEKAIQVVPTTDREAVNVLLSLEDHIDIIIPRGGEGLIRFVTRQSRIPVLKHYKGVCHVYVDEFADPEMAGEICFNAKVQRPGVCNAMETLLVHENIAGEFLPPMLERFQSASVEVRGCPQTVRHNRGIKPAVETDWAEEFLDLVLAVKVVSGMDEALDHIDRYGSNHTESIVTNNYENAQRFLAEVDSSAVFVNASTRFNDGNQLGLGAEIGINTSKLHAFGPMGLEELTTTKFIVYGQGQTRH